MRQKVVQRGMIAWLLLCGTESVDARKLTITAPDPLPLRDQWVSRRICEFFGWEEEEAQQEARQALAHVQDWVMTNGLTLHPDKPHIGDCRQRGEGFDFLG